MNDVIIPKTIHYCWFGKGKMPKSALACIASWKKYCPSYEIVEWNESNFDVSQFHYSKEAYELKKFAFVTDVVRLFALYFYGGIYMDTDVEVIKPLDDFLVNRAFSGFESTCLIPTGIMGAEKGNMWIWEQLCFYVDHHFLRDDGTMDLTTNVHYITDLSTEKHGFVPDGKMQELKFGMKLYPKDYFCPKDYKTGQISITENTHTIHHFNSSWLPRSKKIKGRVIFLIKKTIGDTYYELIKSTFLHILSRS